MVSQALLARRILSVCEEYSDKPSGREHSPSARKVFQCCCVGCMDTWAGSCGNAQWQALMDVLYDIIQVV